MIESGSYGFFFQTLLSAKALERALASNLVGVYRICFCGSSVKPKIRPLYVDK